MLNFFFFFKHVVLLLFLIVTTDNFKEKHVNGGYECHLNVCSDNHDVLQNFGKDKNNMFSERCTASLRHVRCVGQCGGRRLKMKRGKEDNECIPNGFVCCGNIFKKNNMTGERICEIMLCDECVSARVRQNHQNKQQDN